MEPREAPRPKRMWGFCCKWQMVKEKTIMEDEGRKSYEDWLQEMPL